MGGINMAKGITNNKGTADTAYRTIYNLGLNVSIADVLGVYVVVSPQVSDSSMASLGMSLQLTST